MQCKLFDTKALGFDSINIGARNSKILVDDFTQKGDFPEQATQLVEVGFGRRVLVVFARDCDVDSGLVDHADLEGEDGPDCSVDDSRKHLPDRQVVDNYFPELTPEKDKGCSPGRGPNLANPQVSVSLGKPTLALVKIQVVLGEVALRIPRK